MYLQLVVLKQARVILFSVDLCNKADCLILQQNLVPHPAWERDHRGGGGTVRNSLKCSSFQTQLLKRLQE